MLPECPTVLDFGGGDGWFASQIVQWLPNAKLRAIDVQKRAHTFYPVEIVGGRELSLWAEKSIDLIYSVDVLHHCDNPIEMLMELARISKNYILIKDHVAFSKMDNFTLGVLDEIGNRRFGIPSNYKYQKNWQWEIELMNHGWERVSKTWAAPCHKSILGLLTNRLQYVALYRRSF